VTLGTNFHTRNAPALVNSSFYTWTNWAGRFSAQWELPLAVAENAATMNSNRLKLAHFIYDHYKADYEAVFSTTLNASLASGAADAARFPAEGKPKAASAADGAWEGMTSDDQKVVNRIIVNFGKALQAYFRKLVSRDAPFDQYVSQNGGSAISESAKRGAELFVGKANCSACHTGPTFTDNEFHNLGVRQDNTVLHEPALDNGRFADAATLLGSALNSSGAYSDDAVAGAARLTGLTNPMPDNTKAAFRTASLREVSDTAPYMHSGQLATLADVVKFYVAGGGTAAAGTTKDPLLVPLTLSDAEQADLVEFLKTLSGAAVPAALLIDTSGQ
jgi:cytochrome c peroxidase